MATMWLTTFAVAVIALAEVGSYPAFPTSLADLPIDCPFHREPVGLDHIGDTAYGTLTQTGNYEFSKIPGNLVQSGQDYLGYAQNNPFYPQEQQGYYPQSYPEEFEYDPQQYYNQYPTNEGYASILPYYEQNEYSQQPEEGFASFLPYYGEQDGQYQPEESQDGFMSILPYYGEQDGQYQPEESQDGFMSILPYYGDQTGQYEDIEEPEECDDSYQNNEIDQYVNPEQENDFAHVVEVIDNCNSNLNAIYEGACEEITEAEENAAIRVGEARARVNSQSLQDFGLESYSGEEGFTRSLFSLFKPQNMIKMPMKAVNTGMDAFVLTPLQAFSKPPAKKVTETVQSIPANLQQSVLAQFIKPVAEKDVPKTVQPEVKTMQNAVAVDNTQCLRSLSSDLNRQLLQNTQEANQCIDNAEARFQQSVYATRSSVNEQKGVFEIRSHYDAELINMCASSQFKKCQEEEDFLLKTPELFATTVNNDLAQISDAEELLKQELTICEANAETRHEELRDEARDGKASC